MLAARSLAKVLVGTDPEMAARLLGNSEAVSALFGYLPTPDEKDLVEATLAAAAAELGDVGVAEAMAAGAQLSFTELPELLATSPVR